MLRPKALDHVGITVTDKDRSLRFYCEVLGLELLRRRARGPGGIASAVLKVGEQEINVFSDPTLASVDLDANRTGLDHFCLEVASATIEDLRDSPSGRRGDREGTGAAAGWDVALRQ
jgi:glyoxylase I family protein